ncbi:MAG: peroxiredoxin [Gammaproteobacteria bacterium]|nr:peroxiredoxin [Gammaproteobacteria bacterium]
MLGQPAPDIALPSTDGHTVQLSKLQGKHVVLYFYPRDNTPGCTIEGRDFRDHHAEFEALNTLVFGISRDTLKSHANFRQNENFPFHLLADENEIACNAYGVMQLKNMYGNKVMGIERSTFLIDRHGLLQREWRKVSVDGHVDEVLAAVKML